MSCHLASFSRLLGAVVAARRPRRPRGRGASDGSAQRRTRSSPPRTSSCRAEPRSPARSSRASTCASRRRTSCLRSSAGDPIPRAATVFFRQDKKSYKTVVNLTHGTFTPPMVIPKQRRPARPDDHRGERLLVRVPGPRFPGTRSRCAASRRPASSHNVLVTPLTPGSFGLPEEVAAHRQGADVLHAKARHQPLREADRGCAGDHGSRRPRR